jgi:hypothetical protein
MSYQTILTDPEHFNANNIMFSRPQDAGSGKRINISYVNEDGSVGDLIFKTEVLYSFGLSISKFDATKKQFSLVLWDRNNKTEAQMAFVDAIEDLTNRCKDYLMEVKDDLDFDESAVQFVTRKLSPLWWKRDKQTSQVLADYGPTLYCKVNTGGKRSTDFYDAETGELYNQEDIIGRPCNVKAAIQIESLYLGAKATIQFKIREADVQFTDNAKRLLSH